MLRELLLALLSPEPVNPMIAKQILEDGRLQRHVAAIEEQHSVDCQMPTPDTLTAYIECIGTGDFASCFYTFSVQCSEMGSEGPQDLKIKIERTQLGPLLDLNVTANFRS